MKTCPLPGVTTSSTALQPLTCAVPSAVFTAQVPTVSPQSKKTLCFSAPLYVFLLCSGDLIYAFFAIVAIGDLIYASR